MPPSKHPIPSDNDLFARRQRRPRTGDPIARDMPDPSIDGLEAFCAAVAIAGETIPAVLQRTGHRLNLVRSLAVGAASELTCGDLGDELERLVATGLLADPLLMGAAHERYLALPESLRLEWTRAIRHNLSDWRSGVTDRIGRREAMPASIERLLAGDQAAIAFALTGRGPRTSRTLTRAPTRGGPFITPNRGPSRVGGPVTTQGRD
jgi:hypothetical protein